MDVPRWVLAVLVLVPLLWKWSPILGALGRRLGRLYYAIQGLPRTAEDRQRVRRRRRLATHLLRRIETIDLTEQWDDYRFTELEAQVEVRERAGAAHPLRRLFARSGPRRENSLTTALAKSPAPLIQLEGEPGAGKSVALRHLARHLAEDCKRSRTLYGPLPLYFNLKRLTRRRPDVDARLIDDFVQESLREGATVTTDTDFRAEWRASLDDGTWLFLFDSFDEIPEVLGSTDYDAAVGAYSDAIADFLANAGECRGVVASREFKSPEGQGWPKFSILALSERRKRRLIHQAALDRAAERIVLGYLPAADDGILSQASNPLFLSLLCAHVRDSHDFPSNAHEVYERYVSTRLQREEVRLAERFDLTPEQLRQRSEELGFCMAASADLGLEPQRNALLDSMDALGFASGDDAVRALDALTWIKLGVTSDGPKAQSDTFKFIHRRFAEYFATCLVRREPRRVPPTTLLVDGKWRETAVTLLQTQEGAVNRLAPAASALLAVAVAPVPRAGDDALAAVRENASRDSKAEFRWPPSSLHLLTLLQSGLPGRLDELPADLRDDAGELLAAAFVHGQVFDRRWALEVASVAPAPLFVELVRSAFRSDLEWLREAAYRQVSRLRTLPADVRFEVRRMLLRRLARGTLRRNYDSIRTQLLGLREPNLLRALVLLRPLPLIDSATHGVIVVVVVTSVPFGPSVVATAGILVSFALLPPMARAAANLALPVTRPPPGTAEPGVTPNRRLMFMAMQFRLFTPLALFIILHQYDGTGSWVSFALAMYALTWAPAVLYAVAQDRWLHPVLWPVLQGAPIVDAYRRIVALGPRRLATTLIRGGPFAMIIALVFGALGWLTASGPEIVSIVLGGLVALFLLAGAISVVYYFATIVLPDWGWYVRWWRAAPATVSRREFLKNLGGIRTARVARRYVRDIRVAKLLDEEVGGQALVEDMMRAVEHVWRAPADAALTLPDTSTWQSSELREWLGKDGGAKLRRLREFGTPLIDELGWLLEHLVERTRGRVTQVAQA